MLILFDTLKYLAKGGRIGQGEGAIGLSIKRKASAND